jgi:multiple antibiotic resistance protein
MPAFLTDFFYEFVTLLVVLDPVAAVPLFLVVTRDLDRRQSILVAFYALAVSFAILVFFIVGGQFLLGALRIPIPSFQLAGSLVLLLFALQIVMGTMVEDTAGAAAGTPLQRAVFPLAIPCIAGPAAMLTVVLLADNTVRTVGEQIRTTGILALCLLLMFIVMVLSGAIFRLVGKAGIEIISRVFGLLLASIAVTGMIASIKASFGLP